MDRSLMNENIISTIIRRMKPNPFLTSNHFTVPEVTLSEKHLIAGKLVFLLATSLLIAIGARIAEDRIERNMID